MVRIILCVKVKGAKMNEEQATEIAYKNGYAQGMTDAVRKM